jgi:hypothetical protein
MDVSCREGRLQKGLKGLGPKGGDIFESDMLSEEDRGRELLKK